MEFSTSDDKEFILRGGDDKNTALYNRIAAINRINYLIRQTLPEYDIREKSATFLKALDIEIYKKYYQDKPKEKISEEFCQRMAEVCIEIEKNADGERTQEKTIDDPTLPT